MVFALFCVVQQSAVMWLMFAYCSLFTVCSILLIKIWILCLHLFFLRKSARREREGHRWHCETENVPSRMHILKGHQQQNLNDTYLLYSHVFGELENHVIIFLYIPFKAFQRHGGPKGLFKIRTETVITVQHL